MSGMVMTDHLLKLLDNVPSPLKSTRQIKQEQMARRLAARRREGGRQQTLIEAGFTNEGHMAEEDEELDGTFVLRIDALLTGYFFQSTGLVDTGESPTCRTQLTTK